jgi:hypothetical protein
MPAEAVHGHSVEVPLVEDQSATDTEGDDELPAT